MQEKVLKEKTPLVQFDSRGFWCVKKRKKGNFPKTVDTYIEIPPYAVDEETGEILNKSAIPVLKKGEPFNFYEKIQSYADGCDIYSILTKFAVTGDPSLINARVKNFSDVFDVPDNINDFTQLTDRQQEQLKKFTQAQKKIILEGAKDEINSLVQDLVKKELIAKGYLKEEIKEVKDNG